MTNTIINKIGKGLKNGWKYVPISWTIYDFKRKDLDLEEPWQYFKFGLRNAVSFALILGLPLGIYKSFSKDKIKPTQEILQEYKDRISANVYSFKD